MLFRSEQSATMLCQLLSDKPITGQTFAVIAMLSDKAINEVIAVMKTEVDRWFSAGLSTPRGMSAKNMSQAVRGIGADVRLTACESVTDACKQALLIATENDRIIVFGSFYTVSEMLVYFRAELSLLNHIADVGI